MLTFNGYARRGACHISQRAAVTPVSVPCTAVYGTWCMVHGVLVDVLLGVLHGVLHGVLVGVLRSVLPAIGCALGGAANRKEAQRTGDGGRTGSFLRLQKLPVGFLQLA